MARYKLNVSILILLDYLFLSLYPLPKSKISTCLNPYFIGLPILIFRASLIKLWHTRWSQSLFYWITYSYDTILTSSKEQSQSLNPYFIGLPILIIKGSDLTCCFFLCLNPYFIGLPILMVLFLLSLILRSCKGLNPYFIGLPILIKGEKNENEI